MKTKAHTRYRLAPTKEHPKGKVVPGATTVIDTQLGWNKRPLMAWTRKEALLGNDPKKVLTEAGDVGTAVHLMIEAYIRGCITGTYKEPDLGDFTPNQLDMARMAYKGFQDWDRQHELEYIGSEVKIVHQKLEYGGTIDILARQNGKLWLIDPKSSKGIFPEYMIQVVAYAEAFEHANNEKVDQIVLLHLNKKNGEFSPLRLSRQRREAAWKVFKHLLELKRLQGILE